MALPLQSPQESPRSCKCTQLLRLSQQHLRSHQRVLKPSRSAVRIMQTAFLSLLQTC